jgi:hypothetical protein
MIPQQFKAVLWRGHDQTFHTLPKAESKEEALRLALYLCDNEVDMIEIRRNNKTTECHLLDPAPISDQETRKLLDSFPFGAKQTPEEEIEIEIDTSAFIPNIEVAYAELEEIAKEYGDVGDDFIEADYEG